MNLRRPSDHQVRPSDYRSQRFSLRVPRSALVAVAGLLGVATILTVARGCDKPTSGRAATVPAGVQGEDTLDLREQPVILFQVFGPRERPRMLPIAALSMNQLRPIVLDSAGWRRFDDMYLHGQRTYHLVQDGAPAGYVRVKRGMWDEGEEPLYQLEGCRSLLPMADVELSDHVPRQTVVEVLAATVPFTVTPRRPSVRAPRLLASPPRVAPGANGERQSALDSLDLTSISVPTGATRSGTLISHFLDSTATEATSPGATTRHFFLIADEDSLGTYQATYTHRAVGPLASAEFRRYLDHVDFDGNGIDELVVEGWRYGGETWLAVLRYTGREWREIFRSRSSWCLDKPKETGSGARGP